MKPPVFRYVRAHTLEEAVLVLSREGGDAKVLAGGQSLVPMLNFRLAHPSALIDINRIPDLDAITEETGAIRIGALTRHYAVESSPLIAEKLPLIAAAAKHVAHVTIRNRGTFGGSISHHDPAAEWPLVCRLFDAEISTTRATGGRTLAAKDFFVSYLTTALAEDEIVTGVRIPQPLDGTGWGFEEMSRRLGDFALAAVGVLMTMQKGVCRQARIAMAGVGSTPLRASGAETLLLGQTINDEAIATAAAHAATECDPPTDIHASAELRRHLVSVLAQRALIAAVRRATSV